MLYARKHSGFTLIEVMIAVAILAGMAMMMSQTMESVFTSRDTVTMRAEVNHGVYLALSKMTNDLSMAFTTDSTFLGDSEKGSGTVTGFIGNDSQMDFSTMSHQHFVKNHRDTDQTQVGYSVDKKDDGTLSLYRRETDFLTSSLTTGGKKYELLRNVKELKLGYYSAAKEEWLAAWDTGSVSTSGKLPAQVRIQLTVAEAAESDEDESPQPETYFFELVVPIKMYEKITF